MTFLLVVPVVVVLFLYLLAVALCRAARDGDRQLERFEHHSGGWRN